ncbi:hypothetical protein ACWC2K_32055 [Streptomyces chattanoogensis]
MEPPTPPLRKNATYAASRNVARVIRTAQLLRRYLSDPALRRRLTAADGG